MKTLSFIVRGEQFGKQRPRFGKGRTYTPQKTKDKEEEIAMIAKAAGAEPFDLPCKLHLICYWHPTTCWSKAKREQAFKGQIYPTVTPDGDNILKLYSDALNGVAYKDDRQIVEWHLEKRYGLENTTMVRITYIV